MNLLIYCFGRVLIAFVQLLPLPVVAHLGRALGTLAYYLDARHRRVTRENLSLCFGAKKSASELAAIARENFRRLGENNLSAIKTAAMTAQQLGPHFELVGAEKVVPRVADNGSQNRVMAIGHFGNFELYARFGQFVPVFKCATTYRAFKQPAVNRLMVELRRRSDCLYFERRAEGAALRTAMAGAGIMLGLLADQSSKGMRGPFLGHECNTSIAPAVFALRYRCPLHTAICYRVGLARWLIEIDDEIPTFENGEARPVEAIMREVNLAFENAVRRDPANWFWVHRRWKK